VDRLSFAESKRFFRLAASFSCRVSIENTATLSVLRDQRKPFPPLRGSGGFYRMIARLPLSGPESFQTYAYPVAFLDSTLPLDDKALSFLSGLAFPSPSLSESPAGRDGSLLNGGRRKVSGHSRLSVV